MTTFLLWILLLLAGPSSLILGLWLAWKIIKKLFKRAVSGFEKWLIDNGC